MAIFSENLVLVQVVGTIAILITGTIGASAAPILDAIHKYRKRKKDNLHSYEDGDVTEPHGQKPPLTGFDYYMPLITLILKTLGTGVVLATALMHLLPHGIEMVTEANIEMKEVHQHTHEHNNSGFYINATKICAGKPEKCYVDPDNERSPHHHEEEHAHEHHHEEHHKEHAHEHHHEEHHKEHSHDHSKESHSNHGGHNHDHGYPFGMLFASIGILLTFVFEVEMHSLVSKARDATMVVYMTELGMVIHSIPIGVAFAVNTDVDSLNVLVIALCVHQLCEGCAMGPLIQAGARNTLHAILLITLYSASLPVGVVIGAIVKNNDGYSRGRSADLVEGILKCIAGGLLIYISTVEFLAELMTLLTGHGDAHGHGGHVHKSIMCENQEEEKSKVSGDTEENSLKQKEEGDVTSDLDYTKHYPLFTRIICHFFLFLGFASMAIVAVWA